MSNVAKLKKQAAEFEAKKQFDKALGVYVQVLKSYDQNPDEVDLALFNRVGDLHLRLGNVADAVDCYERAVDKYAEGGFFNNAIALCNKILRQSPGRASVYYKLGKISAQKGFKADAKQNFLEYAERMQKSGNMAEAFRALKEFADLCPDQDDIRLMLADQLTKAGKKDEAIEQLQTLYQRYEADGRSAEASATAERLRSLDPSIELRSGGGQRKAASDDLIFIDLGEPAPRISRSQRVVDEATVPEPPPAPPPRPSTMPTPTAPIASVPSPPPASRMPTPAASNDPIFLDLSEPTPAPEPQQPLIDIESTVVVGGDINLLDVPSGGLLDLESTDLSDGTGAGDQVISIELEPTSLTSEVADAIGPLDLPLEPAFDEPLPDLLDEAPIELVTPPAPPAAPPATSDVEMLDLDTIDLAEPPPSAPRRLTLTPRAAARAVDGLPLMDLDDGTPTSTPSVPERSTTDAADAVSDMPEFSLSDDVARDATADADADLDVSPSDGPALQMLSLDDDEVSSAPALSTAELEIPAPNVVRASTVDAARSVEVLQAAVDADPKDWALRRELAEAMLEAGDRAGGVTHLEAAMEGAEDSNDLVLAGSLADELVLLEPAVVKHHQKRVEFAFRRNDRTRLVESYLALAEVLLRSDQAEKARTVYERVLNLEPGESRARMALETLPAPEPPPAPVEPKRASGRMSTRTPAPPPVAPATPVAPAAESFVNLGDWLRDDEGPKDTRMVVEEKEPTGDEDADFADMLQKFKAGVAANVDAEDYQSHYDLAIAYREMGLIDEAISGFQRALAGPANRLPTYEALGQCFIEKEKYPMATSILQRALREPGATDEKLIGVLYLLGRAAEALGKPKDALEYYGRVFVIDIQFKDVADRMSNVEAAAR